jgi:hypothetical protein
MLKYLPILIDVKRKIRGQQTSEETDRVIDKKSCLSAA